MVKLLNAKVYLIKKWANKIACFLFVLNFLVLILSTFVESIDIRILAFIITIREAEKDAYHIPKRGQWSGGFWLSSTKEECDTNEKR